MKIFNAKSFTITYTLSIALLHSIVIADPSDIQYNTTPMTDDFIMHCKQAETLFNQSNIEGAVTHYQQAINLAPTNASAHFNYGLALATQGDEEKAHQEFLQTLFYNPAHTKARLKVIEHLKTKNDLAQASKHCLILLQYEPNSREYWQKLAGFYHENGDINEAIIQYRRALLIDPHHSQLLFDYANTLNVHNSHEIAYEFYVAILESGVKSLSALYNIAYTLKKMNKMPEAIELCKEIITQSPGHAQAHFALSTAYLAIGNYTQGWKEYEWRWKQGSLRERIFSQPLWDGSDLTDKTIYLHAEQGLGDTFQFIRYAKIAKNRGAHVIVAVQPQLTKLLSLCPYIDRIIKLGETPDQFDTQAPLLTLPYIVDTQEDTIPSMHPYLFADEKLVNLWKEKLQTDKNFKIGLCWQGNPNYSTHFLRLAVASKSMRLNTLAPLSNIPSISFYSLQKDPALPINKELPHGFIVHTFDENFDRENGRFMDTAALMKNLNLVITIDTSIAHLAGGLGVPVWVVLPKAADWRWLLDRNDSPWYPTMRLFRQTAAGNWDTVIEQLYGALEPMIKEYLGRTP